MFDEDKLTELFFKEIKQRFGGQVSCKQFLRWCWEWEKACDKIKRYARPQRRGKL